MASRESKTDLDDIEARIADVEADLRESRDAYDKVIDRIACPECGGTGYSTENPDEPCSACDGAMTRGRYDAKLKPKNFRES